MQLIFKIIMLCTMLVSASHAMDMTQQLIHAVQNQKEEKIAVLLDQGADPNLCIDGHNALHRAALIGRTNAVRQLIAAGAAVDSEAPAFLHATPLGLAVYNGFTDTVQALLELGAGLDVKLATMKTTPLHIAAMKGRFLIAELLIAGGANVNAKNKDNCTPLHCVAECGKLDLIQLMKAKQNEPFDKSQKKKPEFVLVNLYVALAKLFLDHGASLAHAPIKGTPLHVAARYNQPELVTLFIERGADLFARRPISATPLHEAVVGYSAQTVQLPKDAPVSLGVIHSFICTPSKTVQREARGMAFPILCCLARLNKAAPVLVNDQGYPISLPKDVHRLLYQYCLVDILVAQQLNNLRAMFETTMKFAAHDFTPAQLAEAQAGNGAIEALNPLVALLDPDRVEQHQNMIYRQLIKLVRY